MSTCTSVKPKKKTQIDIAQAPAYSMQKIKHNLTGEKSHAHPHRETIPLKNRG